MMQHVTQNIEVFSFPLMPGEDKFFFPKKFNLNGKKINRIYLLSGFYFSSIDNNYENVAPGTLGYFLLSFSNLEGKKIVNNLPAAVLTEISSMQLEINDTIDFEDSYITINVPRGLTYPLNLLIAFEYEMSNRCPVTAGNNVYRLFIPNDPDRPSRRYRLSDYDSSALVGRKITKITCNNNRNALLSMLGTDGRTIKVPFPFLLDRMEFTYPLKAVLFENFVIDFNNAVIDTFNNYQDFEMIFQYE